MLFKKQNFRPLIWCCLILAAMAAISGCRQKSAVKVPGLPYEEPLTEALEMRVLVAEMRTFEVNFDGSFQAVSGDGKTVQTFVKRPVPVKVECSAAGISVNNVVFGSAVKLFRPAGSYLEVNGSRYRGSLLLSSSADGVVRVVNALPIEQYLAGVISAEMPASWEIEALKAQAVAARTYSLYVKYTSGQGRQWDVKSTQANQVYKGIEAENARIWDVVNQTKGIVLASGDSDVRHNIIPAYFSSVCGGYTVDADLIFNIKMEPLRGVRCPYCKKTAPVKYYSWPEYVISKAELYKKLCDRYSNLKALGGLKSVRVSEYVEQGDFYKALKVELTGTNGKTDWLNSDDLRFIIGPSIVRSTACRIEDKGANVRFYAGRGYGHNVGMCQYGVQGMAREGKNFRDILRFYYPGVEIKDLY